MDIIRTPQELSQRCDAIRRGNGKLAFVPTMGALHEGHLHLVDVAKTFADHVVVSIFVNPTQFSPGEDLERYPRDLNKDCDLLEPRGANLVFAPSVEAIYPPGARTTVTVGTITENLCGAHRPGHFAGVATVVCKLFNIVGSCTAVFGRKDFQQLQVIRRMTRDLLLPVEVIGVHTVREPDGLAMSSRNAYLSPQDRQRALAIVEGLRKAHDLFATGERHAPVVEETVRRHIAPLVDAIDYVSCVNPDTLTPADGEMLLVAVACKVGNTRLIDNTVLGEDPRP